MVSFNSEEKKKIKPLLIVGSTLTCKRPKRKYRWQEKQLVLVKLLPTQEENNVSSQKESIVGVSVMSRFGLPTVKGYFHQTQTHPEMSVWSWAAAQC